MLTVGLAHAVSVDAFNQAAVVAIRKVPSCADAQVSASIQLKSYQKRYFENLTENIQVVCDSPEIRELSSATMLRVTLRDDQRVYDRLRLKYIISIEKPVFYTKQAISKETVVSANLFYIQTANVLAYAQSLVGPQDLLNDKFFVQDVGADQPVFFWMISRKLLVTTGEIISVTFYSDDIQLKMTGTALQDGYPGDKIRVQLNKTKKIFKVTLIDQGQYEVRL